MSNAYIGSSSVNVFPTALRTTVGTGKFTSEDNITGIVRAVTNDSYIISYPASSSLYTGEWEFVIYGYYFKTTGLGLTTGNNIYAQIKLDSSDRLVSWDSSTILDANNLFKALYITSDTPGVDTDTVHTLQLISSGVVNPEALYEIDSSRIKFNLSPSGTNNLQDEVEGIEDNIDTVENSITSINNKIGTYTSANTISTRLDTDETNISGNTSEINSVKQNISDNYLRRTSSTTEFYKNNLDNTGIQFIADGTSGSEYNDKGASFNTGNTGIGVKQTGSTGSTMGIRAEDEIHIGIYNSNTTNTKLSISNTQTITSNSIIPNGNQTLDLGTSSNYYRNIYGNNIYGSSFSGQANTAVTSSKLGNATIGQGPSGTTVVTSKNMYLNNGTATEGITITFSQSEPSGGKSGDIWFKYI